MKQIRNIILAAASIAALFACNKEIEVPEEIKQDVNYVTVSFNAETAPVTKVSLTPNAGDTQFSPAWVENDGMVVEYIYDDGKDIGEGTVPATFNGTKFDMTLPDKTGEWAYTAFYPAKTAIPFGAARNQTGDAFNGAYDIMNGSLSVPSGAPGKDGNGQDIVIPMDRFTAIQYFHFTSDIDEPLVSATLTVDDGADPIAAETLAFSGSSPVVLAPETGSATSKSITLSFTGTTNAQDFKLWFSVLPGGYNSMSLTIETTNYTKTITRSTGNVETYEAGKLYKVSGVKLNNWTEKIGDKYVKVTSTLSDYTGDYLIVYEGDTSDIAFNGGLATLDVANNGAEVTVTNDAIDFDATTYGYQFHIEKANDGSYSVLSNSGHYIGVTSYSNGLKTADSPFYQSISITENDGAYLSFSFDSKNNVLRYNKGTNDNRFRYYKDAGQQPIYLYKLNGALNVNFPTLSVENVEINPGVTTATVSFTTNQDWTAVSTTNAALLESAVSESGSANNAEQSFTVTFAAENTSFTEDKVVTIHFTAGTISKDITVTQKHVTPVLTLSPTSTNAEASATSASFNVTSCNFSWSVLSITVGGAAAGEGYSAVIDDTDDTKVNVTFPSNVESTTTSARTIVVTVGSNTEGLTTKDFTINQDGNVVQGGGDEVIDVLNNALTGVGNTQSYSNWSNKSSYSDAVYAGNSAGDNSTIQLRTTNNNSGIVTTVSGGKAKKVVVTWYSGTTADRTLDIYGKNTAYSAASDLYDSSKQGTKLGSIVYGTSTELTITGDYTFIGMRSKSGAMFLSEIKITWDTSTGGGQSASTYDVIISDQITNGSVVASPDSDITEGTEVTLTITPDSNYELETLIVAGTDVASQVSNGTYTFEMPGENVNVSATFSSTNTGGGGEETIANATFNGKDESYTANWTTTGTGKNRTDCIIIGSGENITSPAFDLSKYSSVTISIKARRFGSLSGSKATIDASIGGSSVGTTDATGTNATTSLTDITFNPTSSMTAATLVFTCTNATSAGSTHGAGINTITITGTLKN